MYNLFGDKEKLAIEYEFLPNPNLESRLLSDTWGIFKFWINGVEICQYMQEELICDYNWNLYYIVEWFCEKLEYIMGYDPFPLPVNGNNVLELIENADNFESNDNCEIDLWYGAKSRWIFNHCWFSNRDGSILPCVYFRRIEKTIEISWDNAFWMSEGKFFLTQNGVFYISYLLFKQIVFDFLNSIIAELELKIIDKNIIKKWKNFLSIIN